MSEKPRLDELSERVLERLSRDPRPQAVFVNPADWEEFAVEFCGAPEFVDRIVAWNLPVLPLDGIPRGTYAWRMTPLDESVIP